MKVITNPGSNLPETLVEHYGVHIMPQRLVVDGEDHDTRSRMSHAQVDAWVKGARTHPFVLGTTAAEFAPVLVEQAARDPQLLVVMTSRKIIGSHDAAVAAARTLKDIPAAAQAQVEVVDTTVTDLGAGLITLLGAQAAAEGRSLQACAELCRAAGLGVRMVMVPATLDNLVKGGRASFLKAWMADVLKVRPVLSFVAGELKSTGKVPSREPPHDAMVELVAQQVGAPRRCWAAVVHGSNEAGGRALLAAVRRRFSPEYAVLAPLSPSIYLHAGPGALALFILPLDGLPHLPGKLPPPPPSA